MPSTRRIAALPTILAVGAALGGCNALDRLSNVGGAPQMTSIENPTSLPNYHPVSLPMPAPVADVHQANSLWRPGSRAFFKDQRASQVGDIMTVLIRISDQAKLNNSTKRARLANENASLDAFLGYESELYKIFPNAIDPNNLVSADSDSLSSGNGSVDRAEDINLKIAVEITQILPNGNLVITGRQEVRVNYELRDLQVAGIVRPEDITSINTIDYDKIAEARITYGGRGQITDVQQPRYGQQVYDILFPF